MALGEAPFFDAMGEDYDVLEPWYEHLYATLHEIVREALPSVGSAPAERRAAPPGAAGATDATGGEARGGRLRALDAGCGTGFLAAWLAELGYVVHGVDRAGRLLAVARRRGRVPTPIRADLLALPFPEATFEVATCCGSTLSLVLGTATALRELSRVLVPGGRLLLEVEHRPSLDLGWALLSGLMGDPLRYGLSSRQAAALLRAGHRVECWTPYPGYPPLRLFTGTELTGLLHAAGLAARRAWGLHTVTSLLPSTVLHRPRLSRTLAMVYGLLRRLDRRLSGSAVSRALGNSLVVLAVRTAPLTTRSSEAFAATGRVLG